MQVQQRTFLCTKYERGSDTSERKGNVWYFYYSLNLGSDNSPSEFSSVGCERPTGIIASLSLSEWKKHSNGHFKCQTDIALKTNASLMSVPRCNENDVVSVGYVTSLQQHID